MSKNLEILFGVPIIATVVFFFVMGIVYCGIIGGFWGIIALTLGSIAAICIAVFIGVELGTSVGA